MADEQPAGTGVNKPEGSAPPRSPIVFVSDASAEAERITDLLRASGYVVADVPISMLTARAAAQRPNIVVLDVDAVGVLDELARVRALPGSGAIDFVYLGSGAGDVKDADDALASGGSAFFQRPVDVVGLLRRIEGLTGGPAARPEIRASTPPPSMPANRGLLTHSFRDAPPSSERPTSTPSLPAPGLRTPGPPLPMSTTSLADLADGPRSLASFGAVSEELQQLLADAELRAELSGPEIAVPTPEEEIEAVLPADVLASLDEPIDGDEDEERAAADGPGRTGSGHHHHEREGTGAHARGTTTGGSRQLTTGAQGRPASTGSRTHERRLASDTPPPRGITGGGRSATTQGHLGRPRTTEGMPASTGFTDPSPRHDHRSERPDERGRAFERGDRHDDSPPPRLRSEDSPPPRLRSEDSPPPRSRNDDSPPPRLRSEDSPPPRSRNDDSPPPRLRSEDSPPPRLRSEDSPPPRLRSEDSPPPRSRNDDSPPPRLRNDDSPPPRLRHEDTRPLSWHPSPAFASSPPATESEASREPGGNFVAEKPAVIVSAVDACRFFADAVVNRATGALCFESEGVVRRIVMRDGDLVAASSDGEQESLVCFLAARGELPREVGSPGTELEFAL